MTTKKPAAQTAHTPGPWTLMRLPKENDFEVVSGNVGIRGGETVTVLRTTGDANARLIAAAPLMLAALKQVDEALTTLGWSDRPEAEVKAILRIRTAIDSAVGDSK